jgi:hypothetical protein
MLAEVAKIRRTHICSLTEPRVASGSPTIRAGTQRNVRTREPFHIVSHFQQIAAGCGSRRNFGSFAVTLAALTTPGGAPSGWGRNPSIEEERLQ